MDISMIIKFAGIGILVSVAHIVLNKAGRDEMAMFVSLAGVVIVLLMLVTQLSELLESIKNLFGLQ